MSRCERQPTILQPVLAHRSPFDEFRDQLLTAFDAVAHEQAMINRAIFDALSMSQKDVFTQTCKQQGMAPKRIEAHTGKSQPTINRHLNGKYSATNQNDI